MMMLLIRDSRYWKFTNRQPAAGYPKSISEGFPGVPDNVDAAFVWGGNNKIYFFKGSQYWKFDPTRCDVMIHDMLDRILRCLLCQEAARPQ